MINLQELMNLRMARREARMTGKPAPPINAETVMALNTLLASVNAAIPTVTNFSPITPSPARNKGRPPSTAVPPISTPAPVAIPPVTTRPAPTPIKAEIDSPDNGPLSPRMRGAAKAAVAAVAAVTAPTTPVVEKAYSGRGRKPGSKNKPKVIYLMMRTLFICLFDGVIV